MKMYTDKPTFPIKMAHVTKQSGSCDCGLAYITHIAFGLEPPNYVFDQSKMRTHFTQSLEKKLIEPFPIYTKRKKNNIVFNGNILCIEVHCYCHRPYNGQRMVQCNGDCHQWYHLECIKTAAAVQRKQKWFCRIPNCTK